MASRSADPAGSFHSVLENRPFMEKLTACLVCAMALLSGCTGSSSHKDPSKLDSRRKTTLDYFGTACFAAVYDDFRSDAARQRFETAWQEITRMFADLDAAGRIPAPAGMKKPRLML